MTWAAVEDESMGQTTSDCQNERIEADIHFLKAPWLVACSARTVVPLAINVWIKDMMGEALCAVPESAVRLRLLAHPTPAASTQVIHRSTKSVKGAFDVTPLPCRKLLPLGAHLGRSRSLLCRV